MDTTASPTHCPLRCPSSRIRQPPLSPPSARVCLRLATPRRSPAASHPKPMAQPFRHKSASSGRPHRAGESALRRGTSAASIARTGNARDARPQPQPRHTRGASLRAGPIFTGSPEQVTESPSLSLGLTGDLPPTRLHSSKDAAVFELKGVVESLLSLFAASVDTLSTSAASALAFSPEAPAWLEPGRSATALLDGAPIACFGELVASQREARKLRQPVFLAQLDLDALYRLPLRRATARELSRFQAVERDFSFTFADAVQWRTHRPSNPRPRHPRTHPLHPHRDIPRRKGWLCIGRKVLHSCCAASSSPPSGPCARTSCPSGPPGSSPPSPPWAEPSEPSAIPPAGFHSIEAPFCTIAERPNGTQSALYLRV